MAPNSVAAPPPTEEAKKQAAAEKSPPASGGQSAMVTHETLKEKIQRQDWLAEALLDNSPTRPTRPVWSIVVSTILQSIFLTILMILPLFFTEAIDLNQFTQTFLVAPPPPPPPPPPAAPTVAKVARPQRVLQIAGRLVAPRVIPKEVAMLKETTDDLGPDAGVGVVGGVPGGVPGGTAGGVIGGIIGGAPKTFLPPVPAAPTPRAPVRVGGRVMEPRVISNPPPVYPPLAKQAKIQGDVQIDAVIDIHGNVVEMQVISGHPLLINAALDALRRWKYQPTILNDEPVPVQLIVTIRFRMQ